MIEMMTTLPSLRTQFKIETEKLAKYIGMEHPRTERFDLYRREI